MVMFILHESHLNLKSCIGSTKSPLEYSENTTILIMNFEVMGRKREVGTFVFVFETNGTANNEATNVDEMVI